MKVNIQKEMNFLKKEKNNKRKDIKSQSKSVKKEEISSRLNSVNSDIDKLYKKYSEIKKERLLKEKTQQILVNRLKYLRNEAKRSISKKKSPKNIEEEEKSKKIFVKIKSKYRNNGTIKRYKESDKQSKSEIYDNESLSKASFNGNESEIVGSSYKSNNSKKIKNNVNNINNKYSSNNLNSDKENNPNENNININLNKNKNQINDIEEFLKKYKYNIGNKNSNNNIYIIINNPNNNFFKENQIDSNINSNNKYDYDNYTPKDNIIKKHNKYRSDNIIDLGEDGKNIILMNAYGNKLQDIINSINNNLNYKNNNDNKDNKDNNITQNIETENNYENKNKNLTESNITNNNAQLENNNKQKTPKDNKLNENIKIYDSNKLNNIKEDKEENEKNLDNNNKKQLEEKNEGFVRPSFLNLYNTEDSSETKQKIDINSYGETNRMTDNSQFQTKKNIFSKEKKEEEDNKDNIKEKEQEKQDNIKVNIQDNIQDNNRENKTNIKDAIIKCVINQNNKVFDRNIINSENQINNNFKSDWPYKIIGSSETKKRKERNQIKLDNINNNESNSLNKTNNDSQKKFKIINNIKDNNTISIDNFEYYKLYNSAQNTNYKNKDLLLSNGYNDEEKKSENKYLNRVNSKNRKNKLYKDNENNCNIINKEKEINYNNHNIPHNFIKIDKNQISYSLSHKNFNNLHTNFNSKLIMNKENIVRKNNFRKDSYCTSIEKKRKALGLEFKPSFQRELSIQTEKNTEKKKKLIGKIKNSKININNCMYKYNFYDADKLIKVRKKDDYKNIEKKYKFYKKNIDKLNVNHGLVKNKTAASFNFNKINLSNNNNIGIKENELRNKKIKNNIFTFLNTNDNISNKTSDFYFYTKINETNNKNK